jgi:CRISPR-associated protein Csm2
MNQPRRQYQGQNQRQEDNWNFMSEFNADWIKDKIDEKAIVFAEKFAGKVLSDKRKGLSTSQIRNFYGELKRIQMKGVTTELKAKTDFILLKPKLAYATSRNSTDGSEAFDKVVQKAIDATDINSEGYETRFQNFCDFIEAILAYHKAKGGKD